jgi:hypothetical protein
MTEIDDFKHKFQVFFRYVLQRLCCLKLQIFSQLSESKFTKYVIFSNYRYVGSVSCRQNLRYFCF